MTRRLIGLPDRSRLFPRSRRRGLGFAQQDSTTWSIPDSLLRRAMPEEYRVRTAGRCCASIWRGAPDCAMISAGPAHEDRNRGYRPEAFVALTSPQKLHQPRSWE